MAELFWLIPLIPGASAFVLLLFGRRLSRNGSPPRPRRPSSSPSSFDAAFLRLVAPGDGAAGLSKTLLTWIASGSFQRRSPSPSTSSRRSWPSSSPASAS